MENINALNDWLEENGLVIDEVIGLSGILSSDSQEEINLTVTASKTLAVKRKTKQTLHVLTGLFMAQVEPGQGLEIHCDTTDKASFVWWARTHERGDDEYLGKISFNLTATPEGIVGTVKGKAGHSHGMDSKDVYTVELSPEMVQSLGSDPTGFVDIIEEADTAIDDYINKKEAKAKKKKAKKENKLRKKLVTVATNADKEERPVLGSADVLITPQFKIDGRILRSTEELAEHLNKMMRL